MMWWLTDLDSKRTICLLIVVRLFQAVYCASTMAHPDEYWQSTEIAYKTVYEDTRDNWWLPWEWHEEWKLRNCIYPMYLTLPLHLAKFLALDTNWAVRVIP